MVNVTLSNNETRQYPYVWLYDNCQCDICRNHTFSIRASCFTTFNVDVKPQHVQKMDEGLEVSWGDGHSAFFPEKWIVSRTFPSTVSNEVLPWRAVVKYWGNEMQNRVPTFKYNSLIESNQALNQWLEAIKVHGIALIPDAGSDIENLEKLAMRVSYPVPSNFGHYFEVPHFREPGDEPWEAAALPLHTDQAFERVPEIVMLHMVRQGGGGGSHEFVDGFNAASQLREQDPEAFHILATTNVASTYLVPENPSFYRSFCPVISVDDDNQIVTVRFSNHHRDSELPLPADKVKAFYKALKNFHELLSHPKNLMKRKTTSDDDNQIVTVRFSNHHRDSELPLPADKVKAFYKALKNFHELLSHPKNLMKRKTTSGEIVCLNNLRCLHGRTSYMVQPGETSSRLVKGCFLSWQDVESRQRVLVGMREKYTNGIKV
ncbi:gamma-butyrobetaine dioxygenase-like [Anneissia japonica]|uniref:gamma-butyrobetaine dioxygenase-like n=1 Tax=Anneissia japonica TaxID=1529436 RepID=UPI0014257C93|nr:gamma-butyrobetaine dioxygenase-like [Anneissia japonica]